ncbi:histidinol dehydrogenase, partial [Clostridioides difficile]
GVKRIVACSPTMKNTEKINPKTLVAMDIAGADEIYATGGVQASGCPGATMTIKAIIENVLVSEVPGVTQVLGV